ncbi:MAG: SpoVR family protein [bacterium]|nr:SpoVR family protein [bacterium]
MELIDQHTKGIMEGCKERAKDAGLIFQDETLEYIVTNKDLLELSPKMMIPTLYDYWVHDVEVLKEKGKYELYPSNPYETVINTRPPISFYNDNNTDWLNVMIFYHVLAHIDFFQNNLFFQNTWDYDFAAQALADKRLIAKLRSEKGIQVDYIIEFARGIDNIVGYFSELSEYDRHQVNGLSDILNYYFDVFLQSVKNIKTNEYIKEIEKYNKTVKKYGDLGEKTFLTEVNKKHPEFESLFEKSRKSKKHHKLDLIQYIIENSEFLNKEDNRWMKSVLHVVRKTSNTFQPQIRTKIMNEGWASYWHEKLFLQDDRIKGHEIDFSRVNAWVTSLPRVGLNPYAIGMRLFRDIEENANKGKYTFDFMKIKDKDLRDKYDNKTGKGKEFIFNIRRNFCDYMFVNNFIDQEFVDRHKVFVAGKRLNKERMVWEYFVKSRREEDYRRMIIDSMYHPPHIVIDTNMNKNNSLYLVHNFEGKPLVKDFLLNTMVGIEYLWGTTVHLETCEVAEVSASSGGDYGFGPFSAASEPEEKPEIKWNRVLYSMNKRKLSKNILEEGLDLK